MHDALNVLIWFSAGGGGVGIETYMHLIYDFKFECLFSKHINRIELNWQVAAALNSNFHHGRNASQTHTHAYTTQYPRLYENSKNKRVQKIFHTHARLPSWQLFKYQKVTRLYMYGTEVIFFFKLYINRSRRLNRELYVFLYAEVYLGKRIY